MMDRIILFIDAATSLVPTQHEIVLGRIDWLINHCTDVIAGSIFGALAGFQVHVWIDRNRKKRNIYVDLDSFLKPLDQAVLAVGKASDGALIDKAQALIAARNLCSQQFINIYTRFSSEFENLSSKMDFKNSEACMVDCDEYVSETWEHRLAQVRAAAIKLALSWPESRQSIKSGMIQIFQDLGLNPMDPPKKRRSKGAGIFG